MLPRGDEHYRTRTELPQVLLDPAVSIQDPRRVRGGVAGLLHQPLGSTVRRQRWATAGWVGDKSVVQDTGGDADSQVLQGPLPFLAWQSEGGGQD